MARERREKLSLGLTVRNLREENEMSQAQLAAAAEVSQGYLSQIENDKVQNPSAAVLFRIANALFVDPKVILEAAGNSDLMVELPDGYLSLPINLPLIRHIANFTSEQQKTLLAYLRTLGDGVHEREPKIGAEH